MHVHYGPHGLSRGCVPLVHANSSTLALRRNEMNSTDQSPAWPTAREQTSERLLRTRWRIPFAGFLLGLMGGLSYTWGVYINPLVERFGWKTAISALPYSTFMVVFALFMVPAGLSLIHISEPTRLGM